MMRTQPLAFPPPLQWHETATALVVPMAEVERLLQRPHAFSNEDTERILAALVWAGAPAWVRTTTGYFDANAFYFDKPRS
jgi:hypothetical protein